MKKIFMYIGIGYVGIGGFLGATKGVSYAYAQFIYGFSFPIYRIFIS